MLLKKMKSVSWKTGLILDEISVNHDGHMQIGMAGMASEAELKKLENFEMILISCSYN